MSDDSPELSGRAYRHVGDARAALAALDSTAQRLPNPKLFRNSTLRLEAQSTAALEGTYEPLARVLAADSDDVQDPSLREVLNYVIVAETAFGWAEEGRGWGSSDLANLQGLLMRGTSSEREHSGQVRPVQVVIGRREGVSPGEIPIKEARYVPPPPGADLEARLRDLIVWMQADHEDRIDPVVAAAMGHYEFEALHPFHDGNGRLGRLLIVLQLYASGVLTEPTLSVSTWFEARRAEYYDALLGVSTDGDWSTWVEFFAQGLADSADAARRRMLTLAAVQAELNEGLQSTPIRTETPVCSSTSPWVNPRSLSLRRPEPWASATQAPRSSSTHSSLTASSPPTTNGSTGGVSTRRGCWRFCSSSSEGAAPSGTGSRRD